MELEEREHDGLSVVPRCVRGEVDAAQSPAVMARPAAVHPRSHDEAVADVGIVRPDRTIHAQRSHQVLGVEPAAHRQHRAANILQVPPDCTGLPILVVGGMRDGLVPHRVRTSESSRDVAQRSELEEKLVAVTRAVVERYFHLGRWSRLWREARRPLEIRREHERPAVVPVVIEEQVRTCPEQWMWLHNRWKLRPDGTVVE